MSLTIDERQALTQLLEQLTSASVPNKHPEADGLIREALAKQPDAGYLLVQRVLLQEQALNAAKAQIAQLQTRSQPAAGPGGFLGANPWGTPAAAPAPGYAVPPQPPARGGSGFLGDIATTAAGVVAGSFLFQGIESLLGHHQPAWGGSTLSSLGGQQPVVEETVVNNYYGDDLQKANWDGNDDSAAGDDYGDPSSDDSSWV